MNPGPRFNASVLYGHQTVLSNVMWRMQMGQVFSLTPDEYRQLNDLAGCLNYYSAQQPPAPIPYDVQPEIPYGDFSRRTFQISADTVTAFPFRVPYPPFNGANGPLLRMSCAEFGGTPGLRKVSVSPLPGHMDGISDGIGKQAGASGDVGTTFAPYGALLYANILAMEPVAAGQGGSGFSIVWPPH